MLNSLHEGLRFHIQFAPQFFQYPIFKFLELLVSHVSGGGLSFIIVYDFQPEVVDNNAHVESVYAVEVVRGDAREMKSEVGGMEPVNDSGPKCVK